MYLFHPKIYQRICKIESIELINISMQSLDFLKNFKKLTEIHLTHCRLNHIPNISFLTLEIIDLSDNNIKHLNEDCLPMCLKELHIQGNPVRCVKVNFARFPHIIKVTCGSHSNKIHFALCGRKIL